MQSGKITKQRRGTFGSSEFTGEEKEKIQGLLQEKLAQENVSTRIGPGGTKVSYIATFKAIELANEVFGWNGWSSQVLDITLDFVDPMPNGRFSVGVSAIVRVTLKDGTFHEDVGYGGSEQKSKHLALEHAKKEATSDALKRALRLFGNHLGNSIYDKDHIQGLHKKEENRAKGVTSPPPKPGPSSSYPSSAQQGHAPSRPVGMQNAPKQAMAPAKPNTIPPKALPQHPTAPHSSVASANRISTESFPGIEDAFVDFGDEDFYDLVDNAIGSDSLAKSGMQSESAQIHPGTLNRSAVPHQNRTPGQDSAVGSSKPGHSKMPALVRPGDQESNSSTATASHTDLDASPPLRAFG